MSSPARFGRRASPPARSAGSNTRWGRSPACRRDGGTSAIRSAPLACGSERWVEYPLGTKPCLSARWRHQRDSVGAPRLRLGALGRIPVGDTVGPKARWRHQRDSAGAPRLRLGALGRIPVGDEALPVGAMAAPARFGRRPSPAARSAGSEYPFGDEALPVGAMAAPARFGRRPSPTARSAGSNPSGTKPCLSARWRHQRDSVGAPRLRLGALGRIPVGDTSRRTERTAG